MAVKFDSTFNWNIIVTIGMLLIGAAGLYFGLDKTVAILSATIEGRLATAEEKVKSQIAEVKADINSATNRVDGQISATNLQLGQLQADRGRLEKNVDALNALVLSRADQRYTKLDAQRDADAQAKRFDDLAHRMDRFEEINLEQDRKLQELQRVVNRIAEAVDAVHLPPVQQPMFKDR